MEEVPNSETGIGASQTVLHAEPKPMRSETEGRSPAD